VNGLTSVQSQRPELLISTSGTNGMDPLRAEFGASSLATELELSFLAVIGAVTTRCAAFVA
jgi:hypothetical protein